MRHLARPKGPTRAAPAVAALLIALTVLAGGAPAAAAWTNGAGDGYETHDWIVDQALRMLHGRADGWFDRATALRATDDPDHDEVAADPSRSIEHMYREAGPRGGAIERITEHYAAAVRLYREGAAARVAGDEATAKTRFSAASYNVGMLAHFYGDILQPFHSAYAGTGLIDAHVAYERLVGRRTRAPGDAPEWQRGGRLVNVIRNVRTTAIAAAAFSRARYATLYASFSADPTVLSPTVSAITGEVLVRAATDLANIIWSISRGVGVAPDVASLSVSIRWHGAKQKETAQTVYAIARDVNGNPIEGLQVDVAWPLPGGGTKPVRFWTGPSGSGHYTGSVGSSPLMRRRAVVVSATTDGTTVSGSTWYYTTPRLADGTRGFRTTVSDPTVRAGQTVTVHSYARDTLGRPIAGLYVTWAWDIEGDARTTSGLTDATGRASSSTTITAATTRYTVRVTARTSAYSINRSSATSFRRVD